MSCHFLQSGVFLLYNWLLTHIYQSLNVTKTWRPMSAVLRIQTCYLSTIYKPINFTCKIQESVCSQCWNMCQILKWMTRYRMSWWHNLKTMDLCSAKQRGHCFCCSLLDVSKILLNIQCQCCKLYQSISMESIQNTSHFHVFQFVLQMFSFVEKVPFSLCVFHQIICEKYLSKDLTLNIF